MKAERDSQWRKTNRLERLYWYSNWYSDIETAPVDIGAVSYYDPTGAVSGMPVGRCASCHMMLTSFTALFFSGLDANRRTANVIGDVSSHTFRVAW